MPVPRQRRVKRQRLVRSCLECRRRKVKCDLLIPCSQCQMSKQPCHYNAEAARQQESPYNLLRSPILENRLSGDEACRHAQQKRHSQRDFDSDAILAMQKSADYTDLRQRVQLLEEILIHGNTTQPADLQRQSEDSPPYDPPTTLNKTRLFGRSHWSMISNEFQHTVSVLNDSIVNGNWSEFTAPLAAEANVLLRDCKDLARSAKMNRPSRYISLAGFRLPTPPRDIAEATTKLYLSAFESTYRILHKPSFLAECDHYWSQPEAADISLQLKIQLVVAIGSSLYRNPRSGGYLRKMACQWIHCAQNWLGGPLEKDRLSIGGLQVVCLLILARQTLSVGSDLVWMSMGTVVRMAMQMGLHRDPEHFPHLSQFQGEIRRRLWATILELGLQACLDSGMPPMISPDDFNTKPPANVNDGDINVSSTHVISQPANRNTETSIQRLLLDCLPARLKAAKFLNGLSQDMEYRDVTALGTEIMDSCRKSKELMSEGDQHEKFHRNMVSYFLRRFILPIHRPFLNKARSNPLFSFSRRESLDTSMAILFPEPDEDFSRFTRVSGGTVKHAIHQASLTICLELVMECEEDKAQDRLEARAKHRKSLIEAAHAAIAIAAERMLHGESNVKLHLFLNMIMGQIESITTGAPFERSVLQKAIISLRQTYDLLQNGEARKSCEDIDRDNRTGEPRFETIEAETEWIFDDFFKFTDSVDSFIPS